MKKLVLSALSVFLLVSFSYAATDFNSVDWGFDLGSDSSGEFVLDQWTISEWNGIDSNPDAGWLDAGGYVNFDENDGPYTGVDNRNKNYGYVAVSTEFIFNEAEDRSLQFALNMNWESELSESDQVHIILTGVSSSNASIYNGLSLGSKSLVWTNHSGSGYGISSGNTYDFSGYTGTYNLIKDQVYKLTVMVAYDGYYDPDDDYIPEPYSILSMDYITYRDAPAVPTPGAIMLASIGTALIRKIRHNCR